MAKRLVIRLSPTSPVTPGPDYTRLMRGACSSSESDISVDQAPSAIAQFVRQCTGDGAALATRPVGWIGKTTICE